MEARRRDIKMVLEVIGGQDVLEILAGDCELPCEQVHQYEEADQIHLFVTNMQYVEVAA